MLPPTTVVLSVVLSHTNIEGGTRFRGCWSLLWFVGKTSVAAGRFNQAYFLGGREVFTSLLCFPSIDLEPHSSCLLADNGKLPYVAWRATSHYGPSDALTTACWCQEAQNNYIEDKIKKFPLHIQDKNSRGSRIFWPALRIKQLLCSTWYFLKTGDGEENVRPAALTADASTMYVYTHGTIESHGGGAPAVLVATNVKMYELCSRGSNAASTHN